MVSAHSDAHLHCRLSPGRQVLLGGRLQDRLHLRDGQRQGRPHVEQVRTTPGANLMNHSWGQSYEPLLGPIL
jgi:hypothetical protein